MKVIIDARSPQSFEKIYSIALFERILRQFNELKANADAIIIVSPDVDPGRLLSKGFTKRYKIKHWFIQTADTVQTILPSVITDSERLILLEGDGIYDERIISTLIASEKSIVIRDGERDIPLAVALNEKHISSLKNSSVQLEEAIKDLTVNGGIQRFDVKSMNNYVRFLRRNVVPLITRLESSKEIGALENAMYTNTFKGTMEFVAVYGYRVPVRELTRLCAKTPITPNHVTAAALICSFGAIPVLAMGWLWTGLLMAAGFIIFDSLDGKLARMTIRLSKVADRFDHLTSTPTRSGWYLAMGWHLSNGDLLNGLGIYTLMYTAMPYVDKLTGVLFNAKFGRSPLDYTTLDARVHLFTVRKNDIFFMLIGLTFGFIQFAYQFAALWALLTWLWHLSRLIWFSFVPGSPKGT